MLDDRAYRSVRKPLNEAETLPPSAYVDQDFYDLETAAIFHRKWLLIGRTDEWAKTGDFHTFDRFGYSFVVTRNPAGELKAFANSCRHRGSQLTEGSGSAKGLRCPYHSWMYSLDGELVAAPGMEAAQDFDKGGYALKPIKLEVWRTFVFVNFDPQCGPLSDQLGDLVQHFASYPFESIRTVGRREYVVAANWKAYVENSMEWLHHPTVHGTSVASRVGNVERVPVTGQPGDYVMIQSRANGVSRAVMGNAKTFPRLPGLTGQASEGAQYAVVFPYAMIGCDLDSVWYKQMVPEGPNKIRNIVTWCFHDEAIALPDFDEIVPNYVKRFDKVASEDNKAMELQCAGLASPLAVAGRFSDQEVLVHKIDNWVLDQIFGGKNRG